MSLPDPFRPRRCVDCLRGVLHRITPATIRGKWVVAKATCDDCQKSFTIRALVEDWPEDLEPVGKMRSK